MFEPRAYLDTFYTQMDSENIQLLQFWSRFPLRSSDEVLEVGCGPTIFTAIPLVIRCKNLTLADGLQENLDELEEWKAKSFTAFDWGKIIKQYCYSITKDRREWMKPKLLTKQLRVKINTHLIDMNDPDTFPKRKYDAVVSAFCLEDASKEKSNFQELFNHLVSFMHEQSYLGLVTACGADDYVCGNVSLPLNNVTRNQVIDAFMQNNFTEFHANVIPISEDRGYKEIFAAWGKR